MATNKFMRGRIDLYVQEIYNLVESRGVLAIWEKATLCSCQAETGQDNMPDYTCPACLGKGYFYFDPQQVNVTFTNVEGRRDQTPIGLLDVGTALVTANPQYKIGFRDRLTFIDSETSYSEVKTYQGHPDGELLNYPIHEMIAVYKRNVEIPSTEYTWEVGKRHLKFNAGVLNPGEGFSVLYRIRPAYIVIDIPHELRGTYVKFQHKVDTYYPLPKQYMIKREDLLPYSRGQLL